MICYEGDFPGTLAPWIALQSRGVVVRMVRDLGRCRFDVADVEALITGRLRRVCELVNADHGFRAPIAGSRRWPVPAGYGWRWTPCRRSAAWTSTSFPSVPTSSPPTGTNSCFRASGWRSFIFDAGGGRTPGAPDGLEKRRGGWSRRDPLG